jgi:DNA-binding GntR family transcriptional regulator
MPKASVATAPVSARGIRSRAVSGRASGAKIRGVRPRSDQAVYRRIAAAIFEQRLPPGTKLTEDTLGAIFGVSRTIVRNALLRLAHEKIVEIRPNRGAVVASPTAEEARHVFEARRVVEAAIVSCAAQTITRPRLARLRQLAEEERAAHARGDRRAWVRLSGAFHLELAAIAGNGVLADFLRDLVSRTSLIVALNDAPGQSACGLLEHRRVLDAIAGDDAPQAVTLMTQHLQSCEDRLNLGDSKSSVDLRAVFRDTAAASLHPRLMGAARRLRGPVDEADAPRAPRAKRARA